MPLLLGSADGTHFLPPSIGLILNILNYLDAFLQCHHLLISLFT